MRNLSYFSVTAVGVGLFFLFCSGCANVSRKIQPAQVTIAPPRADADWPVSSPEAAGFVPDQLHAAFARVIAGDENVHSILVERDGRLIAEVYRRGSDRTIGSYGGLGDFFATDIEFDADTLHDVRSISKSIVALAYGIARERGTAPSIDAPVLDSFPELADLRDPVRDTILIKHLLGMSTGLAWTEWGVGGLASDETALYWKSEPARYLLDREQVAPPGALFNYNGAATSGDYVEIIRTELFAPLGITHWEWARDIRGRSVAFAGLRLRSRDMLKIGRLVREGGLWRGRTIVSGDWIREMLRPRLATGVRMLSGSGREATYGYQWWSGTSAGPGGDVRWSAAIGNGGQRIYIVPELKLTIVITAGDYGSPNIGVAVGEIFDEIVQSVRL